MKIIYFDREIHKNDVEKRVNEELKGWKIKNIIKFDIFGVSDTHRHIIFVGEVVDE